MVSLKASPPSHADISASAACPPSTYIKVPSAPRSFLIPFHHHLPWTARKRGLFSYPQPLSTTVSALLKSSPHLLIRRTSGTTHRF